jgi:glutamate 5-kinase
MALSVQGNSSFITCAYQRVVEDDRIEISQLLLTRDDKSQTHKTLRRLEFCTDMMLAVSEMSQGP